MRNTFIIAALAILTTANSFAAEPTDTTMNLQLHEVVVDGAAEHRIKTPQMGEISLSEKMILNLPVMFGEPDIVKALQTQPGVSQGVEGFTGLYVRGGENDQNLFLYQGLPLYHVSHLGGIFSSFNVATVRKVDFYKASFPATYGGRISSITDVEMKRPDFKKFTGRFSVGLLSANAYISGPIIKDRTAFAAGLRRSWIDVVSAPALAIINASQKKNGKKKIAHYAFTDFNARIDHRFNNRASIYAIGYYGNDNLKIGERQFNSENYSFGSQNSDSEETQFYDQDENKLSWGNYGVLAAFDYKLRRGQLSASAYYSSYSSTYRQEREYQNDTSDPSTYGYNRSRTDNGIDDIGVKASYAATFGNIYELNAGAGFINHNYLPEGLINESADDGNTNSDNNGSHHLSANEAYAYIDNTVNITRWVALNAGLRAVAYRMQSTTRTSIEPRASLRVSLSDNYSLKAGYARMSQFVQQVSNNYINLPTDLWQPIPVKYEPLQSDQYAIGVYGKHALQHALLG